MYLIPIWSSWHELSLHSSLYFIKWILEITEPTCSDSDGSVVSIHINSSARERRRQLLTCGHPRLPLGLPPRVRWGQDASSSRSSSRLTSLSLSLESWRSVSTITPSRLVMYLRYSLSPSLSFKWMVHICLQHHVLWWEISHNVQNTLQCSLTIPQ